MSDSTKKNGMATASLVLGIISIALFFLSWIAVICGILAVIFAVVAKNKIKADPDLAHTGGAAKGGLITGVIGIVLGIVIWILAIMAMNALVNNLDSRFESIDSFEELMDQ